MSQENVELVRRRLDAVNRGDFDALTELTDPNAVWWDRADDLGAGAHRGREAVLQHLVRFLKTLSFKLALTSSSTLVTTSWSASGLLVVGAPVASISTSMSSMCSPSATAR
jgi:ketosteroid isomerase-like protein